MHPGQKLKPGARVVFDGARRALHGEVLERRFFGRRVDPPLDRATARRSTRPSTRSATCRCRPTSSATIAPTDRERYQTVFARARGSVAAPTAGLHFTPALIVARSRRAASRSREITLHVGYGTFQPVRVERVEEHRARAGALRDRRGRGRRDQPRARRGPPHHRGRDDDDADARGGGARRTTAAIAAGRGRDRPVHLSRASSSGSSRGLLTNFHLPRSSLLMLVSAFAGRERVLDRVSAQAIASGTGSTATATRCSICSAHQKHDARGTSSTSSCHAS